MPVIVTQNELNILWKSSIEKMISECRATKKVPEGLVELIKHNLFAKYVSYNATSDCIEIGVNESNIRATTYTTLKVYTFPLKETGEKLMEGYEIKPGDLEFYTKILKGNEYKGGTNLL